MPEAIQSGANSSWYDPASQGPAAGDCDPSAACCAAPEAAAPRVVTLEPVVIGGDAGAQALLKEHDRSRCQTQKANTVLTCSSLATAVAGMAVTAPTGVGLLVTGTGMLLSAVNCARQTVAYDKCVDLAEARREAATSCEAKGGVPTAGMSDRELVCLVSQ